MAETIKPTPTSRIDPAVNGYFYPHNVTDPVCPLRRPQQRKEYSTPARLRQSVAACRDTPGADATLKAQSRARIDHTKISS